jgi:hypothetical protein
VRVIRQVGAGDASKDWLPYRLGHRLTDFPMMSEWIDDSPKAPAMLVSDWPHAARSGGNYSGVHGIRVVHDHHHPDGPSAKRIGTEIFVLRRLIGYPKFRSAD